METKLGKITDVRFGRGGYEDAMFGLSVTLQMGGSSVGAFKGYWTNYPKGAAYTKEAWSEAHAKAYEFLRKLMEDAKVSEVPQLNGVPVEVTLDGNCLKSWRVLTEVL